MAWEEFWDEEWWQNTLRAIRLRPMMYIGDLGFRGIGTLFHESLEFFLHEHRKGWASTIRVRLHADHSISISDDGDGAGLTPLPHPFHSTAFEAFLTNYSCPAKRNGEFISSHTIGLWVVNALSAEFSAETHIDYQRGTIRFASGECVEPLKIDASSRMNGFQVRYRIDPVIFGEIQYDSAALRQHLWEQAALNPGVTIEYCVEATESMERFRSPEGVMTLLREECRGKPLVWPEPLRLEMQQNQFRYDVAMHCVKEDAFAYSSFGNGLPTCQGGVHVVATRDGLVKVLQRLVSRSGIESNCRKLEKLLRGFVIAVAVDDPDAYYEGPTKEKLANHEIEQSIRDFVTHGLGNLLSRKPDHLRTWLEWFRAGGSE